MDCATVFLRYRDSQRMGVEVVPTIKKFISLLSKVKEHSREDVETAARCADSKQRNARNAKGNCMVVALMATVRAIQALTRRVISVD